MKKNQDVTILKRSVRKEEYYRSADVWFNVKIGRNASCTENKAFGFFHTLFNVLETPFTQLGIYPVF